MVIFTHQISHIYHQHLHSCTSVPCSYLSLLHYKYFQWGRLSLGHTTALLQVLVCAELLSPKHLCSWVYKTENTISVKVKEQPSLSETESFVFSLISLNWKQDVQFASNESHEISD